MLGSALDNATKLTRTFWQWYVQGWIIYHILYIRYHLFDFGWDVVCWPNNQTIELLCCLPCANIGDNVEFRFGGVGIVTLLQSFTCLYILFSLHIVFLSNIVWKFLKIRLSQGNIGVLNKMPSSMCRFRNLCMHWLLNWAIIMAFWDDIAHVAIVPFSCT